MDCRELSEMLAAYLEGVLSPEEKERVKEHLPSCHRCRTVLQDLKRTEELVKGLQEVEPPPWLKQRVMAQARAEEEAKTSIFRKLFYPFHVKVPLEAFATILIALVAIYVFRAIEPEIKRSQSPSTTPEVITKGESPGEALPGEAPPPEALHEETPLREASQKPTKGAPREALKTRTDSAVPGREALEKENLTTGGGQAGEAQRVQEEAREKKESFQSAVSPPSLRAPAQRRAGAVSVAVRVGDVRGAIRKVENLLAELGARRIERESAETVEVVTAELQPEKLKDLFQRLKTIGEVKEKDGPSEIAKGAKGDAPVRIEIIGGP